MSVSIRAAYFAVNQLNVKSKMSEKCTSEFQRAEFIKLLVLLDIRSKTQTCKTQKCRKVEAGICEYSVFLLEKWLKSVFKTDGFTPQLYGHATQNVQS